MTVPSARTSHSREENLRIASRALDQGDFRLAEVMLRNTLEVGATDSKAEGMLGEAVLGRANWWSGAVRLCRSLELASKYEKNSIARKLCSRMERLAMARETAGLKSDAECLRSLGKALLQASGDPLELAELWLPELPANIQYPVINGLAEWLRDNEPSKLLDPGQVDNLLQLATAHPAYRHLVPVLCEAFAVQAGKHSTASPGWTAMLSSMMGLAGSARQMGTQMAVALDNALSSECHPPVQQQFVLTLTQRLLRGNSPYHREASEAYLDFCLDLHPDRAFDTPVTQVQRLWNLYSVEKGDRAWEQFRHALLTGKPDENPRRPEVLVDDPLLLHQYRSETLEEKREIEQAVAAPYCNRIEEAAQQRHLQPVNGDGHRGDGEVLRVGYLTKSAYDHSMGFILQGMLREHSDDVLVTVYDSDNQSRTDPVARKIQRLASNYRRVDVSSMDAAHRSAQQIAADGIDVLVDLEGACQPGYAPLHYFRPAPVSCSYAGADAAGIRFIDYYLADRWCLHEDAAEYYVERPFALPRFTYVLEGFERQEDSARRVVRDRLGVPENAVAYLIAAPGHKITVDLAEDVMSILNQVPGSVLLVKGRGNSEWTKEFWDKRARKQGVDPSRIRYLGFAPTHAAHRLELGAADLVLDTYPYNGASHSFEAMWCGTPVVTRYGETLMSRMGYSMLKNLDLTHGIAANRDEYVKSAVALGLDRDLRFDLRKFLLQRAEGRDAIWDARGITQDLEQALRAMLKAGRPGASR